MGMKPRRSVGFHWSGPWVVKPLTLLCEGMMDAALSFSQHCDDGGGSQR